MASSCVREREPLYDVCDMCAFAFVSAFSTTNKCYSNALPHAHFVYFIVSHFN